MKAVAPLERLATEPRRFDFDAGIRILLHAAHATDPGAVVRFRSVSGLAYPPADILGLAVNDEGVPPNLIVSVIGLYGPSGVLPRSYTEAVNTTLRARSESLRDFLDLLSHRLLALFAGAGAKYRPSRIAEMARLAGHYPDGTDRAASNNPLSTALLSMTGYGTPHLVERMVAGADPLMHYAGLFATQPKSAERLRAMVTDWLGRPVEVRQFVGAWLALPPDQRTRLPARGVRGQFNQLGMKLGGDEDAAQGRADATIGVRAWDAQAGIVLRIGPLDGDSFNALLPDREKMQKLVSLVRSYLGFSTGFAINPVLAASAVPTLQLRADSDPPPRLGWNTWMTAPAGTRVHDAGEARFEADVVEARSPVQRRPAA